MKHPACSRLASWTLPAAAGIATAAAAAAAYGVDQLPFASYFWSTLSIASYFWS